MRVLFIQFNGLQESLGIASLAACLEQAGHQADLLLLSHCPDLFSELEHYRPELIAFSAITGEHTQITELGRLIKSRLDVPIIVGGPHVTFYPEDIAAESSIDYLCRGDGEEPLIKLLAAICEGQTAEDIPNLWVRNGAGGWIRNQIGRLSEDLDLMPIPKREIYYKYDFLRQIPMKRFITGLGCPYSCAYCHNTLLQRECQGKGKFLRRKSVGRVIEEILAVKKLAPLKRIHFSDDLFTSDRFWLDGFAEQFPGKVGIPFSCNTRLDCPAEIIDLLAKAGCVGVTFGFESGSERIRKDYLKKFWSNESAVQTVRHFKKYNIATMANNMISLPGESMPEAVSTVDWNAKIGFRFVRTSLFLPFPGLDLVNKAKTEGLLPDDFSLKDFKSSNVNPVFNKTHANALVNITVLAYLLVKLPFFLRRFMLKYFVNLKPNKLFDFTGGCLNLLQHYLFFNLTPLSAWRYFKNTLGLRHGLFWSAWQRN